MLMWKRILGKDIKDLNTDDLLNIHSFNCAMKEVIDNKTESFRWELEKALEANPGGQEDDNRQQGKWKKDTDSQATLPRENSQGERSGENNHNKNPGDSNPGRQEYDNPQQGKWKKNRVPQRENSQGERNGENNHNKKHRDSNPGRQEHDGKWKKNRDFQRENSQGERNGENNHNKNNRDSNPGRQEYDNPQQGKWKKNRVPQRENSRGERNGENNHNKKHRTPHQNVDTTVNTNSITTLGENIKQKLQRNKWYIAILLGFSLWLPVSNTLNSWKKKNPKKVTTEQKDSIKRDSESETIDKVSATGELSHFVKEGESMYSIVTNLKSSWTLSGISSVREDIIRVACEKGFIMKIKEGQTTKGKFDPRNLSPGDVIVIKIKEFENLHRQ